MNRLHLYCVQGAVRGASFALADGTELVIGRRSGDADVAVEDALASRRHVRLTVTGQRVTAEDLNSSNGTRVNGRKIEQPTPMEPGDILSVGHTSLVLECPGKTPGSSSGFHLYSHRHDVSEDETDPGQLDDHSPTSSCQLTPESDTRILIHLLASVPMGVLLIDHRDRVVLANEMLKRLCDLDMTVGRDSGVVLERLATNLVRPQELHNIAIAGGERAYRLACHDGDTWLAWARRDDQGTAVFVLPERLVIQPSGD